jgi:predicted GNAT superfamily acetyltransferase
MDEPELDIRTLESASDMASIGAVFQQVWGTSTPIVTVELLIAIAHSGGYVAAAFESGNVIGASVGFLADHEGERALHSHITGILPGVQHAGVGRLMKFHQREWAAARNIPWIIWTFDPLVRRNAWFNIEVLGGHVTEYCENFYGVMADSINSDDESDRVVIAWPTTDAISRPVPPAGSTPIEVATPEDIVVLRRTDPAAAAEWRRSVRDQLVPILAAGGTITGFTRAGSYVVHPKV